MRFFSRRAPLLAALPLIFGLLNGCGGGGSGGSQTNATPTPVPANGQLFDDFDGASLDASRWGTYGTDRQLQLTRYGNTPQLLSENGASFARFSFNTFNPTSPGLYRGTEIFSRQRFARGNGLEIKTRLRGPITQPGIVFAFFGIYDRFSGAATPANYSKTEIDFEFLTAEQERFSPSGQRRRLYLNIWDDWNQPRDGFDSSFENSTTRLHDDKTYPVAPQAGFDWADWHTYTIRWFPDRTEFLVDGARVRTEREILPDEALFIHFNIWSGMSDFATAFSPSLRAATSSADNQTFAFDVDYVRVGPITP